MKNHFQTLKKLFLTKTTDILSLCDCRLDPTRYAAELDARCAFSDPMDFGEFLPKLLLLYYLEESSLYHDEALLSRAEQCLAKFNEMLRENGTLDDLSSGTHSTHRTAEAITQFFPVLVLIERFSVHTEAEDKLYIQGLATLRRMADALVDGGFREGYHRWLITAALAVAHHFLGDEKYPAYADTLLAQGVNMSENGEYPERNHTASILCNRAFILTALMQNDESFLTYPRNHLHTILTLLESDGTVSNITAYGWNQTKKFSAAAYYPAFLTMAITDRNSEFAYIADSLEKSFSKAPADSDIHDLLLFFMTDPTRIETENAIESTASEKRSSVFFEKGKLVRIDKPEKNMTMTLFCAEHPVFFELRKNAIAIEARFAGSFFGSRAQFRPTELIPTEDGYKLIYDAKAGYRSQLKEKPETSNWRLMDHSKRELINIQQFRVEITVHILEDGARFDIETTGCERIPTKFELVMTPNHVFDNESITKQTKAGDYIYLKDGTARYHIGWHSYAEIETHKFHSHTYGEELRGAVPKDPEKFTVCMTADTPQHSTVTLRIKELD